MLRSLGTFGERTVQRAQQAKRASAEVLLEETKAWLDRPGGGRVYRRGRLGSRLHTASAPGEPPAPDSGALRDSARIEQGDGEALRVIVSGPGASRLEFGARDLAPRPYLRPALASARNRMGTAFAARLRTGRK